MPAPDDHGLKLAAIAITVTAEVAGGEAAFLLTRRASTLRSHGGQYALPGGRLDAGEDASLAALRELSEEVGLHFGPDHVLGQLDDYCTRSGYAITPVVVWGGVVESLSPNPDEVAAVHRIPLAVLDLDPIIEPIPESDRPIIRVPLGNGDSVNPPTAPPLHQFREVCLHGRPTRVSHYDQPAWAWG